MTTGLLLATAVHDRITTKPLGAPLARFSDFRFSEHLGWGAVLSLVAVLLPKLAVLKTAASNVLLFAAALYAVRVAAAAAVVFEAIGAGSFLLSLLLAVIILLMLPVAAGGILVLGVLDTGIDFRRRWRPKPPVGG